MGREPKTTQKDEKDHSKKKRISKTCATAAEPNHKSVTNPTHGVILIRTNTKTRTKTVTGEDVEHGTEVAAQDKAVIDQGTLLLIESRGVVLGERAPTAEIPTEKAVSTISRVAGVTTAGLQSEHRRKCERDERAKKQGKSCQGQHGRGGKKPERGTW